MHLLKFKIFEAFEDEMQHALSTRKGGVSPGFLESLNLGLEVGDSKINLAENYRRFCEAANVDVNKLVLAEQIHEDRIIKVMAGRGWNNPLSDIDAFITIATGVPLCVRFADCQGVLLYDPVKKAAGAVHCGWRGNTKNIIGKTVIKMRKEFGCNSADLFVGISQSLGPCCAKFSDPKKELPDFMRKYIENRHVNLWQCSLDQLADAGVLAKNIELIGRCTVCENNHFFSYRGGKKQTGHMAAVIELR